MSKAEKRLKRLKERLDKFSRNNADIKAGLPTFSTLTYRHKYKKRGLNDSTN